MLASCPIKNALFYKIENGTHIADLLMSVSWEEIMRVGVVRGIGLVGLFAAFLLLSSAQSFQPAPKLHRANSEGVPP